MPVMLEVSPRVAPFTTRATCAAGHPAPRQPIRPGGTARPRITQLAILVSLLVAAPCTAQDRNVDIRAAADAFDSAQFRRDRAALEALIAPDYLAVFGSGRIVGRAEFIDGYTAPGVTFEPFEITDRLFLRITSDAAVVGGEGRIKGVEQGKPFAEHFRFSDTFAKRGGKWLVVFTQVTPLPK